MTTTFFIGDTHFGHKNILKYEPDGRPFATIEEHDAELVKRWNSVVGAKDKVYHLGDFCFGRQTLHTIAPQLHGEIILISGNHDVYQTSEYLQYFSRVQGALYYKQFVLTHIPVHPLHARAIANIHGHLHSKLMPKDEGLNYVNVSAEQINLTPIAFDDLLVKLYKDTP